MLLAILSSAFIFLTAMLILIRFCFFLDVIITALKSHWNLHRSFALRSGLLYALISKGKNERNLDINFNDNQGMFIQDQICILATFLSYVQSIRKIVVFWCGVAKMLARIVGKLCNIFPSPL